jgi:hypothetical protein
MSGLFCLTLDKIARQLNYITIRGIHDSILLLYMTPTLL